MKMPSYFGLQGEVKPNAKATITTLKQAKAYFKRAGGVLRGPVKAPDGSDRWTLDHRGWSHGGVPDEGLIHIANEDNRLRKGRPDRPSVEKLAPQAGAGGLGLDSLAAVPALEGLGADRLGAEGTTAKRSVLKSLSRVMRAIGGQHRGNN